ncbi:probable LRR receptor-like serine/threonine-protein kinase At3g47570 [Rosa rugosa]|uniref:probable LRR receptor-like serine/threonine-protein kinase At3g47570 n=1 Tax=Rosa rugosa TaxID=74645 RepID=UPI002B418130|nr:probable LRR receptor-like serine/threonine-protein kinase At3g47570 [Rosa rugosa]
MILCRKRNVEAATDQNTLSPQKLLWRKVSRLELLRATNGFSECNLLGTGGFGSVYKGTMSDGIDVAIKVFNLEVGVSRVLIMNRLDIMIDVASALEYFHHGCETPIIHCDLKPSNILLDDDMVAHVADFGIVKLLGSGNSTTHTITLATIGYMAPEYGIKGIVSRRGDVYSFGIVLMETFTKRKPTDEMFGVEMSMKQWVADSLFPAGIVEVVDANLFGTEEDDDFVSKECLSSLMRLALVCCAESPEKRISMQDVLAMLNKIKTKFLKKAAGGAV